MYGRGQQKSGPCKYYQQGKCRYGDNCKFTHEDNSRSNNSGNYDNNHNNNNVHNSRQQANQNPFAPLSNQGNSQRPSAPPRADHYRPSYGQTGSLPQAAPYLLTKEGIEGDLKYERPIWLLSAYGPGRDAPKQLIEGDLLEQSPEEMRVAFYLAAAQGNVEAAKQNEQDLFNRANAQAQQVLSNLDGAVQYILAGKNEPNNRLSQCIKPTGDQQIGFRTAAFGTSGSAFGQPSGTGSNAVTSSLGKPSVPAFGSATQPSAFGQASGQPKPSVFSQPSAPTQGSAFGQSSSLGQGSAFGKPAFSQSAFGQPSALSSVGGLGQPSSSSPASPFGSGQLAKQGTTFGQPSAFGASQQQSTFGQPSVPATSSSFGQTPAPATSSPFGQSSVTAASSSFGQPSLPTTSSPFGQSSIPTTSSPFGQSSVPTTSSPFGQSTGAVQSSGYGGFTGTTNPFSQPSGTSNTASFGQNGQLAPTTASNPTQGFGQAAQASNASFLPQNNSNPPVNGTTGETDFRIGSPATPDPSTYRSLDTNGNLTAWKGGNVRKVGDHWDALQRDGTYQRIFHPQGPPPAKPGLEDDSSVYNDKLEEEYKYVSSTGTFKDGVMPAIPPKQEWVRFDL